MTRDEPKFFVEHLDELRTRLLHSLIAFAAVLGAVLAVPSFERSVAMRVFRWLSASLLPSGIQLVFLDAFEPAWVILKVGFTLAAVILSPYLLYQMFCFMGPALEAVTRRTVGFVILAATGLFVLGMAFAYALIIPASLRILLGLGVAAGGVAQMTMEKFYTFVLTMLLVFGIPFEMPLVLGFLVRLGVLSLAQLRTSRRTAYLAIVIFSAVVTPDPTPFSQLLLSAALIVLFEASLLACAVAEARRMQPAVEAG